MDFERHNNSVSLSTRTTARIRGGQDALSALGVARQATLYLDRCQVDTPQHLVDAVWKLVRERRSRIGKVVDFGCGDSRFARAGKYRHYVGYEIDRTRCSVEGLPPNAEIVNACAFSERIEDADLCVGNPPYVRNQNLPVGWRQQAARTIETRTGVTISGLANAWQYFVFLSLVSAKADGVVALIVPFEWVSRPSSNALREFIRENGWAVSVYRLNDETFDRVLTTSSITFIDKASKSGIWEYFREVATGTYKAMRTATGGRRKPLAYERPSKTNTIAKRGLSPGTQVFLTLTEGERVRCGLRVGADVVPCVTSLRQLSEETVRLSEAVFKREFIDRGQKCWLIRTDKEPSARLMAYLDSVPEFGRDSSTCRMRDDWWRFTMPETPSVFMASGFRDGAPKVMVNAIKARAVGSVCGIFCKSGRSAAAVVDALRSIDYKGRVVSHSNGLRKLEINQINSLLSEINAK